MGKFDEIINIRFEGISSVNKYAESVVKTKAELDKLIVAQMRLKGKTGDTRVEFEKNASAQQVLKTQLRETKRNMDNIGKASTAMSGSIKQQREHLKILKDQYINLSRAERENLKTGGKLKKEIHGMTEELKKQEKAIGVTSRNVGNYEQSITDAAGALGPFGGQIIVMVQGFKKSVFAIRAASLSLKGFKGALVGTGIGAIVVALGSLLAWFSSTKRGAEAWDRVMIMLSATTDVLIDRLSSLGETIINAFTAPGKVLQSFKDMIDKNVVDQIFVAKEAAKDLGIAFKSIFDAVTFAAQKTRNVLTLLAEGEIKKAGAALIEAKDAAVAIGTAVVDTGKAAKKATKETAKYGVAWTKFSSKEALKAVRDIIVEIGRESLAMMKLEERLQKLADAERILTVAQAQRRTEINKLRNTVKDEMKTFEERNKALKEAQAIQNELSDLQLEVAQERVDIVAAQNEMSENMEEDEQRLADARTQLAEVEEERQKRLVKFTTERNLLLNQEMSLTIKLQSLRQKGLEGATKLEQEFLDEVMKMRVESIENDHDRAMSALDLKHDTEIRKIQEKFDKVAGLTAADLLRIQDLEKLEKTKANSKDLEELERLKAKLAAKAAAEEEYNALIIEKDKAFLAKKTALVHQQQVETLEIAQSIGESIGQEFINILDNQAKNAKDFLKFTVTLIIQTLEKHMIAAIAESQLRAAAKGIFGIPEAALKIAAIKATFAGARLAISKFEQGGLVEGGVFQGNSHAQGGVKFSTGGKVMEAEGGEAIINRKSTSMFKPILSAINQIGGGKRFAQGGITPSISPDITNPLLSLALTNQNMSSEISSMISSKINDLKVINVVADTTAAQISVSNVESEAIF